VMGKPLPPENHCQSHSPSWRCAGGIVSWQLVAAAVHVSG
jgi:hypothetical protein